MDPGRIWAVCQLWADVREARNGFGPGGANVRNSSPRARKVERSDLFEFKLLELGSFDLTDDVLSSREREMAEIQRNDPEGVVREVEEAQMPHELNPLYDWVNRDVLGSPYTMTEEYLMETKNSGVIFGGGEEEGHYRVELPRQGERVCELNLEHPRVPHWLWVNEVMFTEFGVRIPFSPFQQRLLQRCFVAPSQFHPNTWSAIRCFELVTEFPELPQDPEVFLYLFTVFSPNTEGKAKKGYMSVRPRKGRKIFGLYEDSFQYFKGRYFKVFAVGDHPPFWLTLERDAVKMAGRNKTLANLRLYMVANPQGPPVLSPSGGQASTSVTEGGGSSTVGGGADGRPEVSSPIREEEPEQQVEVVPPSPLGKRANDEAITAQKRPRTSEGSQRDFCPMDRSFDASSYIENNFLDPRAREALQDYDPMESIHWVEWAMLRATTVMKSIEPRLTLADQWEHRCAKLTGDLKLLNQQKAEVEKEKEKEEAKSAKSKAEKDLEAALADAKEKGVELQCLRDREAGLLVDVESTKKKLLEEKSRADHAEASLASAEQVRRELVKLAVDSVKATEDNLKEQILLLAPDFDVSLIGAWKEVVDEVIVDLPPPEGQIVDPPPQD
ncbi:hypothetical protein PIB30_050404 [Stylosanthes scabra]|uniref:Transposase (Putative), gypsy type n=1 Tax=Stylosanthes scabra TaxID=79078 RepID=A0ABU6VFN3_9FABA|nr:hypothetical protein [Stylosanthes scabra]